jgi:Tfp pilus assembly protein PilN
MIEINLLPGAKRKQPSAAKMEVGAAFRELASRFNADRMLVGSISLFVAGMLAVAAMWYFQGQIYDEVKAREAKAHSDSLRFAQVIKQRAVASAVRDSVVRQLRIVNTIDGSRFVWPHVLEEVSRALPAYTWLIMLQQTSPVASLTPEIDAGLFTGADPSKIAAEADSALKAAQVLRIKIIGQTVDVQAITRFWKQLEASPFLQDVQLVKTEVVTLQPMGKEATQFTLEMRYQQPDSTMIRRAPFRPVERP